eukprot:8125622-Pyramimonas_sp.AAC.1
MRLPPEEGGPAGKCARLNKSLYGTQDASRIWQGDYITHLAGEGWRQGVASAALIYRESDGGRGAVHGDDFMVLGGGVTLSEVDRCLGPRFAGAPSAVEIEGDQRRVDMILRELGLDRPGSKGLESPASNLSFHEAKAREALPTLDAAGVRSH